MQWPWQQKRIEPELLQVLAMVDLVDAKVELEEAAKHYALAADALRRYAFWCEERLKADATPNPAKS